MREKLKMFKTTRHVAVIAAAMLLAISFGSTAQAMVLSLDANAEDGFIPASFDLTGSTGLAVGDPIKIFNSGTGPGGINLDAPANIEFTFLGSEAAATNGFQVNGGGVFTQATPIGTTSVIGMAAGLLDFVFTTNNVGGNGPNGGPFGDIQISFADLGNGSFIALFGDGQGDIDRDDFAVKIAVSAIPLPPAVWLFISAILGLVSFTRIRRTQNAA